MENAAKVHVFINAPVDQVWDNFVSPEHVTHWYSVPTSWKITLAEVDLIVGGHIRYWMVNDMENTDRMIEGTITAIDAQREIKYTLKDGRSIHLLFQADGVTTSVAVIFDIIQDLDRNKQREEWQSVLLRLKRYVEGVHS